MLTKSLYISPTVSNFYGTGIENLAGFGSVGNTEKKIWADYEQLLMRFFHVFTGKKNRNKTIVASALKSCKK